MRPTLTVRDDGVERLIANLPTDTTVERDQLRNLAKSITRMVSVWQIEKAKEAAAIRETVRKGIQHGRL